LGKEGAEDKGAEDGDGTGIAAAGEAGAGGENRSSRKGKKMGREGKYL